MSTSPQFDVDILEIRKHYDRLSRFYRLLWGEHLHHGYWENGESIQRAQVKLMEQLAEKAGIGRGARVLDIGCGLGGSAFWLADQYDCRVTGFPSVQFKRGWRIKKRKRRYGRSGSISWSSMRTSGKPEPESVDVVWIMESSEHFRDKKNFFERCARALKPGGVLAVCAWLRGEQSTADQSRVGRHDRGAMLAPVSIR